MKLFGRILALFLAAVISVLTVQQVIRRIYHKVSGKYITLPAGEQPPEL